MAIRAFIVLLVCTIAGSEAACIICKVNAIRIPLLLIGQMIYFMVTQLILHVRGNAEAELQDFLPFIAIPLFSVMAIAMMGYLIIVAPETQGCIFYAICIMLILNILICFLFFRLICAHRIKMNMELLNLQYKYAQKNACDVQSLYDNIHILRHDLKNHLQCIYAMSQKENISGIREYVGGLLENQTQAGEILVSTGNDVLDAIVNAKYALAKQHGIRFRAIVTHQLREIAPEDICVLPGNALDNAVTAAKECVEKEISLSIQAQGAYASIMVSNSIKQSVLQWNPSLKTTKAQVQQHGFGIRNIKSVAAKYHGMVQFQEEDGQFICDVLLLRVPSRS